MARADRVPVAARAGSGGGVGQDGAGLARRRGVGGGGVLPHTEAAVAKFDIFDADSVVLYPYPAYRESHTYNIESIAPPVNPIAPAGVAVGANLNNFSTPGNCNGGTCQYTECVCTRSAVADADRNVGCNEIDATTAGDE